MLAPEYKSKWRILADTWKLAQKQGGLRIPCTSQQEAHRLRGDLYMAVRRARKPRSLDEELVRVAESLSITYDKGDVLYIYSRTNPPRIERAAALLNKEESEGSFERLQALLEGVEEKLEKQQPEPIEKSLTYRNPYLLGE